MNKTAEAMIDPQPGDLFTERYSFWLHIVDRNKNNIKTLTAHGGNTVPPDGKVAEVPLNIFLKRFQYDTIPEKYWVTLVGRNKDFSEFLKHWNKFEKDNGYDRYINPIHKDNPFIVKTVNQILNNPQFKDIITEMVIQSILKLKLENE